MTKALSRGALCTVAFAATHLELHPKTVLRFIREGRLKATRIGKSYRILRADLDAFAGVAPLPDAPSPTAWVTSIVDVPGVDATEARQWAMAIPAALKGRGAGEVPMRADVIHDAAHAQLKIVLVGALRDTAALLAMVQARADRQRNGR